MKEEHTHIVKPSYSIRNPKPEIIRIINEYFNAKLDTNISNKERSQKFQADIICLKNSFWDWKNSLIIDKTIKEILKTHKKELKKKLKENDWLGCLMNRIKFQAEQSLKNK